MLERAFRNCVLRPCDQPDVILGQTLAIGDPAFHNEHRFQWNVACKFGLLCGNRGLILADPVFCQIGGKSGKPDARHQNQPE